MRALLLALLLAGCASEEPEPATSLTEKQCVEGGKVYKVSEAWQCSDGCNSCRCEAEGVVATKLACDAAPPFMVDSATPPDVFVAPDTAVADAAGG